MRSLQLCRLGAAICALAFLPQVRLDAQRATVRDSAGIRIVQNVARSSAPIAFKLSAKPLMDVGGIEDDPAKEFNNGSPFLSGALLSNGGLAVIDDNRVQFFDAKGKRLKIVGQKGAGPADFNGLSTICRTRGDTLVLDDGHNGRSAILDATGKVVRTISRLVTGGDLLADACFDDGTLVAGTPKLRRVRIDGTVVNALAEFAAPPWSFLTQYVPSPTAAGQSLYLGTGLANEVKVYNMTGKLTTLIRTSDPLIKITDAAADKRLGMAIPSTYSSAQRRDRLEELRSQPHVPNWPAYGEIHADPAGRLWVQDYVMDWVTPSPDVWTAFDASGQMIGKLMLPPGPKGEPRPAVAAFGNGNVLIRSYDADGAQHLVLYDVIKN